MEGKTVYLLRHGRIATTGDQRRYIGQADLPLEPEGVRQAERLRALLGNLDFFVVYCSDLVRSRDTAKIIAGAPVKIKVHPGLREISLGDWEGRTFDEVARCFPDQFEARGRDIAYYRPPGGESFADCSKRAMTAFHQIMTEERERPVIIVGHAGVNRVILSHVLGMPLANLFRINQDFGCINIIQYMGANSRVKAVNLTLK